MGSLLSLVDELAASAASYSQALEHYHTATARFTLAKRSYETAKACYLCEGVEGKNQAERDARLEGLVIEERAALEFFEDEQARVRLELEQARLAWDLARYKVRALESMFRGAAENDRELA